MSKQTWSSRQPCLGSLPSLDIRRYFNPGMRWQKTVTVMFLLASMQELNFGQTRNPVQLCVWWVLSVWVQPSTLKTSRWTRVFILKIWVMSEETEQKGDVSYRIWVLTVLSILIIHNCDSPSVQCAKGKCRNLDNSPQMYLKGNVLM